MDLRSPFGRNPAAPRDAMFLKAFARSSVNKSVEQARNKNLSPVRKVPRKRWLLEETMVEFSSTLTIICKKHNNVANSS